MAAESPVALIYGYNGTSYIETTIRAGLTVPAGQPGFMALGSDGTAARYLKVSATGVLAVDGSAVTQPVSGTFWQATQPVSIATMPTTPVTGTFWQATQPVSAAALPLPSGASTSAKQPALGTAGTASADVLTVQGIAGMVALKVDGSGVTQPVSVASLPLPSGAATETTLTGVLTTSAFQARVPVNGQAAMSGSVPVVIASNQSVLPINDNAGSLTIDSTQLPAALVSGRLDVNIGASTSIAVTGTFWQATQPVSAASLPLPTGAATETTLAAVSGKLPAALVGGRLDSNVGAINNVTPLMGNGVTGTGSLRVTIASDNTAFSTNSIQSGSWTVTANAGTNLNTSALALDATLTGNNQRTRITDGTSLATIKAASTAPVAGDTAIVVVLSPNQQAIPVTTNPTTSSPTLAFGDITLAAITTAAIRRTTYTEQTTNFTGSIVSASANDSAAGTGARTVKIYYVDQTGATAGTETVTMNGTTPVNLVTSTKCFIEKMEVVTVGSTGSNAGIITLKTGAAGAGTTVGTIGATDNTTLWAHHYVVTGKTANVTGMQFGTTVTNSAGVASAFLRAQIIGGSNLVEKQVSDAITVAGLDSSVFRSYGSQIQIAGPARITMYVATLTGSSFVYRGSFDSYDV